jgi:hypothetical protein
MVIAYRSGVEDRRVGIDPKPWPWDDGGPLESAYLAGYDPAAELRRRVLMALAPTPNQTEAVTA